jgi:hypothetical protein
VRVLLLLLFLVGCATHVHRNDKEVMNEYMTDREIGEFVGACAMYYGVAKGWKHDVAKGVCQCMLVEQVVLFGDKFKDIDKDERRREQNTLIERACVIKAQAKILDE